MGNLWATCGQPGHYRAKELMDLVAFRSLRIWVSSLSSCDCLLLGDLIRQPSPPPKRNRVKSCRMKFFRVKACASLLSSGPRKLDFLAQCSQQVRTEQIGRRMQEGVESGDTEKCTLKYVLHFCSLLRVLNETSEPRLVRDALGESLMGGDPCDSAIQTSLPENRFAGWKPPSPGLAPWIAPLLAQKLCAKTSCGERSHKALKKQSRKLHSQLISVSQQAS